MRISPKPKETEATLAFDDLDLWIERYLGHCQKRRDSKETLRHYGNALARFSRWYQERMPDGFTKSQASDFEYWLATVKRKYDDHPGRPTEDIGLSPMTIRRTIGVVRTFLRWMYESEALPVNLAFWFPRPRVEPPVKSTVDVETINAILRGASEGEMPARDVALITLLADTGLRRAEIAMLTCPQVIFTDKKGAGYLNNVKGSKVYRTRLVPFSEIAGQALKHYTGEAREYWAEPDCDLLFVSREGGALAPRGVYEILRRAARRGGVADETWNTHAFRHAFATNHWRVKGNTKALSLMLGHASQRVTEDLYVHASPADLVEQHVSILDIKIEDPEIRKPPSKEELHEAILETPNWNELGRQYGYSGQWIRMLAKEHELIDVYQHARALKRVG